MASTVALYIEAWWRVAFSIFLASAILYKAVIDRQRRIEEIETLPYQQTSEHSEDWMSQYQTETPEPKTEVQTGPVQEVPKATYEAMFRHQHGVAEPTRASVDTALVAAATDVLDHEQTSENQTNASPSINPAMLKRRWRPPRDCSTPRNLPHPPVQTSSSEPVDDLEFEVIACWWELMRQEEARSSDLLSSASAAYRMRPNRFSPAKESKFKDLFQKASKLKPGFINNRPKMDGRYNRFIDPETIDFALQDQVELVEVDGLRSDDACPIEHLRIVADACDQTSTIYRTNHGRRFRPWKGSEMVSEHKADEHHPVVSMASILAKEERDRSMQAMSERVGIQLGSGYPADPTTKASLEHLILQSGIDEQVRWGWATVERFWKEHRTGDLPVRGVQRTIQQQLFHEDESRIS